MRLINQVRSLKPGQAIEIDMHELREEWPSRYYNDATFTPPDRLLENIVGSCYEFGYSINPMNGNATFHRLKEPREEGGVYTSPDRRIKRSI